MRTVYRTFDEINKTMQELEDFPKKAGVSSKISTMIMLMYEEILLCRRERFPNAQYRIKLNYAQMVCSCHLFGTVSQ